MPISTQNTLPPWTSQQADAILTRHVSVTLSAGAGCGKTFVLTQRFLQHLQPPARHDPLSGIVAITFTERAAREMRDRIRDACHAELQRCATGDVAHWLKILRGLDTARISTIHSFCASLLRSHAVDAGIDPRFGLLEEVTGGSFLRNTVVDTLNNLLAGQNDECLQLVRHYGLERTVELLRSLVRGRFQIDFSTFEQATVQSLAAEWSRRWHEEFVPILLDDLVTSHTTEHVLHLLAEHTVDHPEMQRRQSFLLDYLSKLPQVDDPRALLDDLRCAAQVQGGGGKSAWQSEAIYDAVKDSLTRLRKSIDRLREDLLVDRGDVETAVGFALTASRVTQRIIQEYEAGKQEAGLLDFDDLLQRTRLLLRNSESVRSRAAAGIDFLMVDEFQDTDPVQSEIVRLLCGDQLLRGKLFVVGDAKQSIYRFRRADPGVFDALSKEIPEQGRLPLSTNFRSQPEILKFVNGLFSQEMGTSYEPLSAYETRQLSPTPTIEFLFASGDPASQPGKEKAESRRAREAGWIAHRLGALFEDETPRIRERNAASGEMELRRAQPGDVAILFRTLSNVGIYEEALRKHGLLYYLVGGRAFYAQQEIFDLANLCLYLDDSGDQVALAGVLRSPFFSFTDETILALVDAAGTLGKAMLREPPADLDSHRRRQVSYASTVLAELRRKKDRLPLATLLNLAVVRTGYDASLLHEFLGRRKLANLRKLIDMARQFDRSGLYTLTDFSRRLRESVSDETDEELAATDAETSDVIRLMTIHQAKGLEFPVVILADMDWIRRGGADSAHFHPELGPLLPLPAKNGRTPKNLGRTMHQYVENRAELAETTRLLYVATTRACDHLILSAGLAADRKPKSPWLKLLARRFDLETGLPAADPYLGRLSLGDVAPDDIPEIDVHHQVPETKKDAASGNAQRPLSEFRQSVAAAQPAVLPSTLRRIEPNLSGKIQFSVSQIEESDEELRSLTSSHTAGAAGADGHRPKGGREGPESSDRGDLFRADPATPVPNVEGQNFHAVDDSQADAATQLGTLVHAAIERIDFQTPGSLESLVEASAAIMTEPPIERIKHAAITRLQAFAGSALFRELAEAKQVYRELDFLLRWPGDESRHDNTIISGQIDCLCRTSDGRWLILDYKTGRVTDENSATVPVAYEVQLALYALAARALLGRLPDGVELVVLQNDVRRIPLEVTDDFLEAVGERVDAAVKHLRRPTVDESRT